MSFPTGSTLYAYMPLPSAMLSHDTGAICGLYNFGKYNIFHRPDETMLLSW